MSPPIRELVLLLLLLLCLAGGWQTNLGALPPPTGLECGPSSIVRALSVYKVYKWSFKEKKKTATSNNLSSAGHDYSKMANAMDMVVSFEEEFPPLPISPDGTPCKNQRIKRPMLFKVRRKAVMNQTSSKPSLTWSTPGLMPPTPALTQWKNWSMTTQGLKKSIDFAFDEIKDVKKKGRHDWEEDKRRWRHPSQTRRKAYRIRAVLQTLESETLRCTRDCTQRRREERNHPNLSSHFSRRKTEATWYDRHSAPYWKNER